MRRLIALATVAVIAAVVVVVAATTGGGAPAAPPPQPPWPGRPTGTTVALRRSPLGSILVDARGRTLYLFEADQPGMSACARRLRRDLAARDRDRDRTHRRGASPRPSSGPSAGRAARDRSPTAATRSTATPATHTPAPPPARA